MFKTERDIENERIQNASVEEKYRRPPPNLGTAWDSENFFDFIQIQRGIQIRLNVYRCLPDQPKCVVFFFHGLNEHMGLYTHIAQALKSGGAACYGFDFRGFGKSQGEPGWIESNEQHITDCEKFISLISPMHPGLPQFCIGQSLGGATAYQLGLRDKTSGVILITPAIMDNEYNEKYGKLFAQFIGGLFPTWRLVKNNPKDENKNPAILEYFQSDKFAYKGELIPATIKMIVDNMKQLPSTFGRFKTPFMIISGGMDKLVAPEVGKTLMAQSISHDKTLIHKENMWHNAILEEEIIDIIPEIVKWIQQRY